MTERYADATIRVVGPVPQPQRITYPGEPPARSKMPLCLIGGVAPNVGLVGGVAEIRGGRDGGTFIAFTSLLLGGTQLVRGGVHWLVSAPVATRARAYDVLFAFLAEWTYHAWPEMDAADAA